jgi:hypothetical protein
MDSQHVVPVISPRARIEPLDSGLEVCLCKISSMLFIFLYINNIPRIKDEKLFHKYLYIAITSKSPSKPMSTLSKAIIGTFTFCSLAHTHTISATLYLFRYSIKQNNLAALTRKKTPFVKCRYTVQQGQVMEKI